MLFTSSSHSLFSRQSFLPIKPFPRPFPTTTTIRISNSRINPPNNVSSMFFLPTTFLFYFMLFLIFIICVILYGLFFNFYILIKLLSKMKRVLKSSYLYPKWTLESKFFIQGFGCFVECLSSLLVYLCDY
jgi:flagellar biosynthesis protein FlhB